MASKQLNDNDIDVCRSSLTLLTEMRDAAVSIEDMQGEVPTEIINACVGMRKQMAKIVEAKSMYSGMIADGAVDEDDTVIQITIYLDMLDQIDQCLNEYKARYMQLHQEKLKDVQDQQKKVQKKLRKSEK
jgi:hypothetical protein